jgi:hypothetical protein
MHALVVAQPMPAQTGLAGAVGAATTMGLILAIPQQAYYPYFPYYPYYYYLNTNTPRPYYPLETCPACGNHHPPGAKFCSECDIRLQCQACGAGSWGKNFCHNCGQTLKR